MTRCPNCWREDDVAAAHYRWQDALVLPLLLWPFRCASCNLRFYRPFWTGLRTRQS